jgi:hypothetical protein
LPAAPPLLRVLAACAGVLLAASVLVSLLHPPT